MFFLLSTQKTMEWGLLCIRIGIGAVFMIHGAIKLYSGPVLWHWLGEQLVPFGITWLPVFWGFLAANIEFLCGLCLIGGFVARLSSFLLFLMMVVALVYHFRHGDAWSTYAYALSMIIVIFGIFIAGPGFYSIDQYIYHENCIKGDVS